MKQTCSWVDAVIFDEDTGDESVSRIIRVSLFALLLVDVTLSTV
jgi:hypothetical protein